MSRPSGPLSRAIAQREAARGATPSAPEERDLGPEADPESVARRILLDQLTARARTRAELAGKLRSRGVADDVAEPLLDRFTEVGLIDDAGFARDWVEQRRAGRGLARRALSRELHRKGVDDETTREVLAEIDTDDEVEVARVQVRRKLRSVRSLDRDRATRRLVGMLARKGHAPGVAYRVVREELTAVGCDGGADGPIDPDAPGGSDWSGP